MYHDSFYLKNPTGNNAFSFDIRKEKQLFVPSLIEGNFLDVKIWDQVVFADIGENGKLQECIWLEHFIQTTWNNIPVYIFDNHNHAFYFWHEAQENGIIQNWATLIHIDEHSDLREPAVWLDEFIKNTKLEACSLQLESIFRYTNEVLEVGNYIRPAEQSWLIWKTHCILTEWQLLEYKNIPTNDNLILNLDLDFFEPRLDDISFELKKEAILHFARQAKLITIATSPFFIDQNLAIKVLNKLFVQE